jgi:CHAT domain-containing protein
LVNFGALPDAGGAHLIESGSLLHYLSAERDLVKPHPASKEGGFLVMGAPRFGDSTGATPCPGRKRPAAHGAFDPIPASLGEAKEIADLLASRFAASSSTSHGEFLTGQDATEEAFKRLVSGRRVINLATHTFVGEGDVANLLQMSGLAFAGANDRMCEGGDSGEDGILTAEEIATLDLSAAEWVVLSGCDTGVGPIQSGEGVLGLRRAFEIAGARTLVMSLWEADDEATRTWMEGMYRSRLRGTAWPEALRDATLSLIADRKNAGLSVDPYYWGTFVATGDWK